MYFIDFIFIYWYSYNTWCLHNKIYFTIVILFRVCSHRTSKCFEACHINLSNCSNIPDTRGVKITAYNLKIFWFIILYISAIIDIIDCTVVSTTKLRKSVYKYLHIFILNSYYDKMLHWCWCDLNWYKIFLWRENRFRKQ